MAVVYKAIKVELSFLCENTLETKQALEWVMDSMDKFCDFYAADVKLLEEHHNVLPMVQGDGEPASG